MRDYGKVSPQFWIGETGKRLKAAGPEAVVVAMYLMTSPHSNMIGLYWLPKMYLAHETGLGMEGASKGLQRCIEGGFCAYDEASEYVLVFEMAKFQIADELKPTDNRCKGVWNDLIRCPNYLLQKEFHRIHAGRFHLQDLPEHDSQTEAPSKPLGSQEQEQEQEQIQEKEAIASLSARADASNCPHSDIIDLYHKILPANPRIKVWDGARADALRTRWREDPKRQNLEYWQRYFTHVSRSPFLTGRVEGKDGRTFLPGLDWLVKASNFAKVIENRYHDQVAA